MQQVHQGTNNHTYHQHTQSKDICCCQTITMHQPTTGHTPMATSTARPPAAQVRTVPHHCRCNHTYPPQTLERGATATKTCGTRWTPPPQHHQRPQQHLHHHPCNQWCVVCYAVYIYAPPNGWFAQPPESLATRAAAMDMTDERRSAILGAMKNISIAYTPRWAPAVSDEALLASLAAQHPAQQQRDPPPCSNQ